MKKIFFIMLVAISFTSQAQNVSTKGTEFWLTYMENLMIGPNGPPTFSIIISSDVATSGTVSTPATGFSIAFNVTAGQAIEVVMPQVIYYPEGDEDSINLGIKITSLAPVDVYTYHHRLYFSEASIVLPIEELSTEYLVVAHTDYINNSPSEFVVEATRDSTPVEINPSAITTGGRPPYIPFTKLLNAGEVYQFQSWGDLTGTTVKSLDPQKKIAVFGGARQANIYCSGADNTLYDEMYPETSAGTAFVTVPFLTNNNMGYDFFRFTATADSTDITVNTVSNYHLNRGQFFDTLMATPAYVTSTHPIFASQFKTSMNCSAGTIGDPSMLNLTPAYLRKRRAIFNLMVGPGGVGFIASQFVNIITSTNATGLLTVDGLTLSGFQPVPSNPAYSYAAVPLPSGDHVIASDSGFNACAYGVGYYNAYTFHLGYEYFSTTGINGPGKNGFKILISNPVKEIIQIHLDGTYKNLTVELYNILGSLVVYKKFNNVNGTIQIDIPELNKGVYFLRLNINGEQIVKKIVKE